MAAEVRSAREAFESQVVSFNEHDLDGLLAHFTEDCLFVDMSEVDNPWRGRDGFGTYMTEFFSRLPDLVCEISAVSADERYVAGEVVVSGTYRAEGIPETPVRVHYCVFDEVENGLIKSEHVYWNSIELERQLGKAPPPFAA
jgi:steroid delta-isomerase-like uncharacterized protein